MKRASLAMGTAFLIFLTSCNSVPREATPAPSHGSTSNLSSVPQFNAQRAFRSLTAQTDFGPRNPGSVGYRQCLAFFQKELGALADTVFLQPFSYRTYKGEQYPGANVIGRFRGPGNRILLSAHWDTRAWADQDEDANNHNKPLLGANDGASGVAVLLELAQAFKNSPPPVGIDIVLFDAEDVGQSGNSQSFGQGSQYFAKHLPPNTQYSFAINIDMIGDRNLEILREENSDSYAPNIMDLVFSTARLLGIQQFNDARVGGIYDDHMPLNEAGIPSIDLIDFNYPDDSNRYWHTMQDTPDKCSPESLEAVGTVLLNVIYAQRPSN